MRVPRRRTPLYLVILATLLLPAEVLAATSEQVVTRAESYGMTCTPSATDVDCVLTGTQPFGMHAVIKPVSGHETSLLTQGSRIGTIPAGGLDVATRKWMVDLQALACGAAAGVSAFVDQVGDLTKTGTVPSKVIGACQFDGRMVESALFAGGNWYVQSTYIPPPPTPTPTAKPTAKPTARPTPKPTPVADETLGPESTPSATSVAPSGSPPAVPSDPPTIAPSSSPAATVAVGPPATGPAPTASAPIGAGGSDGSGPAPTLPTFSQSVLGISEVSTEADAVGGNLLLALLLLLLIAFAGELFNNSVENNYSEISGWFKKGPLGWLRRIGGRASGEARSSLLGFLALTALISSFVDPQFGLDLRSLAEFLGFLVGLIVVLASFKLPMMLAHRRKTGELGKLRPLPWALVIAALFVLISRIGNLQPGYLYGIVLGAIFVREVPAKEEGRETFYGSVWTLAAAALGWLGLTWVRSLGYDPSGFGATLLSTAFAAVLVAGLEATAFGLMPLRFMPGNAVYKWNRLGWGLLFGLSVFAFLHLLISPTSGYVSTLSPQAFIAACGIFAAFGALSIATWAYFRFKPKPAPAAEPAEA